MLGILLILPSSVLAWTDNENPLAFWELDETGATYADATGNSHGFTYVPDAPTRAAGVMYFGQDFDGSTEYLQLDPAEEIDMCGATKFIISFWVFVDVTASGSENIITWSGGGGTRTSLLNIRIGTTNDRLYFGGYNQVGTYLEVSSGATTVPIGEWTLITVEWYMPFVGPDWAPNLNMWMNGVQVADNTWASGTNWGLSDCGLVQSTCTGLACQMQIGRGDVGGTWYYNFNGRMDDVGVWMQTGSDSASSSQKIHEQMWNSGVGKYYTNLAADSTQNTALLTDVIAHYDLDEISVPYLNSVDSGTFQLQQGVASQRPAQATGLISFGQDFERATLDEVYATGAIWDATGDGWSHQHWVNIQTEPALGGTCGGAWGGVAGVTNFDCPGTGVGFNWESDIASSPSADLELDGGTSSIGSWHHLLTTFQGTGTGLAYFYVDGKIMDSGIRTDATSVPVSTYWLGHNGASATNYNLDGTMDEVALWQGRALNVEEVIALYNSGAGKAYSTWGGSPPGPGSSSNVSLNVGCPANVDCSLTYDPLTSIFNYTINDTEQTVTNITLDVTYINGSSLGYATFSTNSTANYTGSVLIDASSISVHNWTMRGFGYITDNNRTFISGSPTILTNHLWIYGSSTLDPDNFNIGGNPEGLFWAAAMIASLMLFGAWNPPVSVMLGAIGVVLATWFGLLNISTTTLWTVVIAALVVAWGLVT